MDSLPIDLLFEILGKRICDVRQSKGLPQKKVAEICGLDTSNYNKIEFGKRHPTLPTLFKIAFALEEPISSFFNDEDFKQLMETHTKG